MNRLRRLHLNIDCEVFQNYQETNSMPSTLLTNVSQCVVFVFILSST